MGGGEPSLYGRREELETLSGHFVRAVGGRGGLVMLSGEPGVGKSRLLRELCEVGRARGALVLSGRAWEVPDGLAYTLLAQTVGPHLRALPERARNKLMTGLPELDSLFVGLRASAPQPLGSPELEKMRLSEAFCVLVERIAAARPLLIALDDLHWADRGSLEMLYYLGRNLAQARVLMAATCRVQEPGGDAFLETMRTSLAGAGIATTLSIQPLADGEARQLARELLRGELSPALDALIAERARGVPLFVSELVRSLQSSGHIVSRGGRFCPAEGAAEHLPPTIRDTVRARLLRLQKDDRSVLEAMASAGAATSLGRLARVCERPDDELPEQLQRLAGDGWIIINRVADYELTHPLVRESILDGIAASDKRRLHLLHLRALEALPQSDRGWLARHYAEAGPLVETARALAVVREAAEEALRLLAHVEAVAYFEVTVGLARRLEQPALLAEVLEAHGRACADVGEVNPAAASFAEAAALFVELGEGRKAALVERELALVESRRGRLGEARAALQAAATRIAPEDDLSRLRLAEAEVLVRQRMGDVSALEPIADELRRLAERMRLPEVSFTAKQIEGTVRLSQLDCPRAYRLAGEALAAARELGQPLLIYRALLDRFIIASSLGQHAAVADQASEAVEIARSLRSRPLAGVAELGVLLADWIRGDFRIAAQRGPELFDAARRAGDVRWAACAIFAQGMVACHRGELAMARVCLSEGARQAEGASDDALISTIHQLLEGELLLAEGKAGPGVELVERACGPAPGRLMKTQFPVYMCLRLGLAYVRAGRPAEARALAARMDRGGPLAEGHADRIRALAGAPDAVSLLERACARMRTLGIFEHLAACSLDLAERLPAERRDEAVDLYREALQIGRRMDDPPSVTRARSGLAALGVAADGAPAPSDDPHVLKDLSTRESEVAILLSEGLSRDDVADRLGVSAHTVATYIKRIYERLGFTSRVQLTRYVLEHLPK